MTAEHNILTTRLGELLATPSEELTETQREVKEEVVAVLSLGFRKIDDDAIGESLTG